VQVQTGREKWQTKHFTKQSNMPLGSSIEKYLPWQLLSHG
jgi:hypothetical protein